MVIWMNLGMNCAQALYCMQEHTEYFTVFAFLFLKVKKNP